MKATGEEGRLRRFAALLAAAPWRAVGWREERDIWELGVLDARAALAAAPQPLPAQARWLDAGSGNGLNAIPLALAQPGWRGLFVERHRRKAAWLEETRAALGVAGEVLAGDLRALPARLLGAHDVVTARALAPPAAAAGLLWPLVAPGGILLIFAADGAVEAPGLPPAGGWDYAVRPGVERRVHCWRAPLASP